MSEEKQYYAFISYKREDKKDAKRLQHQLEYYRLPNQLRKDNPDLPEYVRPIFRDMTDLDVGELSPQIHEALEQSHYLIVVCSPRAAKSKWVNDEVEYFISLGKQDKIIPYIIEGVPHADDPLEECYPPALLQLSKEKELLGANINEVGKEAAGIRVVAKMFGIRYDMLYQRYKRDQRRKYTVILSFVIAFILLLLSFSGYVFYSNNELQDKNEFIKEQMDSIGRQKLLIEESRDSLQHTLKIVTNLNDSLVEKRDALKESNRLLVLRNAELKQSQWAILRAQSIFVSGKAIDTIKRNSYLARKVAIQMLPHNLDSPDRPYTAESELLLRMANKYHSAYFHPSFGSYEYADISSDNKFIIALPNKESNVYIYDTYSGKITTTIQLDSTPSCVSISEDSKKFVCGTAKGSIYIWKRNKNGLWGQEQYIQIGRSKCNCISLNKKAEKLAACINDSIFIWNSRTDTWICSDTLLEHKEKINSIQFGDPENQILSASNDKTIRIWEIKNKHWECIDTLVLKGHVSSADFGYKNKIIASANSFGEINIWEKEGYIWSCNDTIIATNTQGEILYPYEVHFRPNYSDVLAASYWSSRNQIIQFWAKNYIKDGATGQIFMQNNSYKSMWKVISVLPGDYQCVRWSHDGNRVITISNGVFINQVSAPIPTSSKIKLTDSYTRDSLISQGYSAISPNGDYYISIENSITGSNQIRIWNKHEEKCVDILNVWNDKWYTFALFSPDGKRIISGMADNTVRIWDFPSLQELINETSKRFKDTPLTPEERRKYYLE